VNLLAWCFTELTDRRLAAAVITHVAELIEAITAWGSLSL
jgi:hypothetical protein